MPVDSSKRRLLRFSGWAACGLLLAQCREAGMSSAAEAADVGLTVVFERDGDALKVSYALSNQTQGAIGVYDGATGDEEWPDLTGSVYVSLESRDRVGLKRVLPSPPRGVRVAALKVPAASRVDTGQTRSVQFCLPLPLSEHSEYFPDHPEAEWREGEVSQVRLTIGFQRAGPDAVFQPRPKNPKLFKLASGFGPQEFVSAEQNLIIPVRARLDKPFERV
jgi:hypothetical protein